MADLTTIFLHLQRQLFPALASELGLLSAPDQQFCEVIFLAGLGRIPVSAALTSASVRDSQVAILLTQLTVQRVTSLYDLRDSAYDAPQILAFSRALGHVPIIDLHPLAGEKLPFAPAPAQQFKERSASERLNRWLKERYGGSWVHVRGAAKAMCYLMLSLVALTATALLARRC